VRNVSHGAWNNFRRVRKILLFFVENFSGVAEALLELAEGKMGGCGISALANLAILARISMRYSAGRKMPDFGGTGVDFALA
jgi:hypothetical protein